MCLQCDREAEESRIPPDQRSVPHHSGEGAIYSPEYLARKEGNDRGTEPHQWRLNT